MKRIKNREVKQTIPGFKQLNKLKHLLILPLLLSAYGCSQPNISTVPEVTPSSAAEGKEITMGINSTTQSYLSRLSAFESSSSVSFNTDCAGNSGFKVEGQVEGQPCEADSFSGIEKFIIPPEYNNTEAVMVSGFITDVQGGSDIIKGVMKAGGDVWYLSTETSKFNRLKNSIGTANNGKLVNLNVVTETIWARDWSPLMAKPAADFQESGVNLKMVDINYYIGRQIDNSVSRQIKSNDLNGSNSSLGFNIKRASLPVYMEGGNIMCNESNCFLSQKVIDENKYKPLSNDLILNEHELKSEFKKQIEQDVWFVQAMPYEPTKHIDMWSKFLNKDTLLIGQITDETLKTSTFSANREAKEVQSFLEVMATGKDNTGKDVSNSLAYIARKQNPNLKIIRVPMPLPGFYIDSDSGETAEVFRSYTNSLLVNGFALIPQYTTDVYLNQPYADSSLKTKYETEVKAIYEQAGYQVIWIPSDSLIGSGGAVHCVTMQVPA